MYGDLLLVGPESSRVIRQAPLGTGSGAEFTERWLRDKLFDNPVALPFRAIDPIYENSVPICRELRTDAGPIDALFANEHGLLTMLECKLWRNPQARREVVGQVLDYARGLAAMGYEDLSRQVNASLRTEGNTLFQLVERRHPGLVEHVWIDQVSRNLAQGRFLIVVAGDGIQEGVVGITELLQRGVGLRFHFGLVEVALFRADVGDVILQPRLLARTVTVERSVVRVQTNGAASVVDADDAASDEGETPTDGERSGARKRFWDEFIASVRLEGGLDPAPRRLQQNSVKARLPLGQWITAYRAETEGQIGLWFQARGDQAPEISRHLRRERADLEGDIGLPIAVRKSDDGQILLRASADSDEFDGFEVTAAHHEWLAKHLKAFTRALGPRLRRLEDELSSRAR